MYNVPAILNELDITIHHTEKNGDAVEYYARCPWHKEDERGRVQVDHEPSWSINHDTGEHNCFSCGFAGTPVYLAFKMLDLEWDQAVEWANKYKDSLAAILAMDPWEGNRPALTQRLPINNARLQSYPRPTPEALERRHVTAEACLAYDVHWDAKKEAWILPIRSPEDDHALWGWQMKGEGTRLFRNYPFGVEKSETLFGVDVVKPTDTIVVVESPLDAVRLYSLGIPAVSTYGAGISDIQFNLMMGYAGLIAAMDNPRVDDSGAKASLKFLEFSRRIPLRFFNYGDSDAKDVGDMDEEQILFGIENARHALWGKQAVGL